MEGKKGKAKSGYRGLLYLPTVISQRDSSKRGVMERRRWSYNFILPSFHPFTFLCTMFGIPQSNRQRNSFFVAEVTERTPPRAAMDKHTTKQARVGEDLLLPCIAQGYPIPTYRYEMHYCYFKLKLRIPYVSGEKGKQSITLFTIGVYF